MKKNIWIIVLLTVAVVVLAVVGNRGTPQPPAANQEQTP
jgi:hypothetical protein